MEAAMNLRHVLVGAATAIGLGWGLASAQAAPAVATAGDLTAAVLQSWSGSFAPAAAGGTRGICIVAATGSTMATTSPTIMSPTITGPRLAFSSAAATGIIITSGAGSPR